MTLTEKQKLLDAWAAYVQQTTAATRAACEEAFTAYADVTDMLVQYFELKFNPKKQNQPALAETEKEIEGKMPKNPAMKMVFSVLKAMVRTNFYSGKDYVSFKIQSAKVAGLPAPRPMAEIFVSSDIMDGVHLRFGKIARGGIRWSDRKDDFRTEILGLVKAQQVKNVVIVPVGSKGGFYVKNAEKDDSAQVARDKAIAAYKTLIRGILDLTDNISGQKVVPAADIIRYDEDDPYLVVAADKGTASFSDIANALSAEYGFWLGDAFASGGSAGYDHKGIGITAKGAWESIKRHFREAGIDANKDFTVVGSGSPAGDVFGNGMILNRHINLIAAFGSDYIFLDPHPDAETSFNERKRLFDEGKRWGEYNKDLLSEGGMLIKRSAERVTVTPQVKEVLDLREVDLTCDELIQAILHAPVDLMYFGGIGTYVKATSESQTDAKDSANAGCRVNAIDVRAKVVAEGANLGFTQKARVEYAMKGGRINSDALDNSAGVDCSDHEVNIKILLNAAVADGKISVEQRNEILKSMTDDVERLVLRDNYLQTQILSYMEFRGAKSLPGQKKLINRLEKAGRLDRALENLPSDAEMDARFTQGKSLTRSELGVLMAYAKLTLNEDLLNSDLPDDAAFEDELFAYFPPRLQKEYPDYVRSHRLRREIVATVLTNGLINRVAVNFTGKMQSETGAVLIDVVKAYAAIYKAYGFDEMFKYVESRDDEWAVADQFNALRRIEQVIENQTATLLRRGMEDELSEEIARIRAYPDPEVAALKESLGL